MKYFLNGIDVVNMKKNQQKRKVKHKYKKEITKRTNATKNMKIHGGRYFKNGLQNLKQSKRGREETRKGLKNSDDKQTMEKSS